MKGPDRAVPLSLRIPARKLTRQGVSQVVEADAAQLAALASALDLPAVHSFAARMEARLAGQGLYKVSGELRARVRQLCVLSAEEFDADVSVPIDAAFADAERLPEPTKKEVERSLDDEDPPEPLDEGAIDLGALAVEFLALALDPFPRKPGAAFAAETDTEAAGAFAALAALKPGKST
jgi:hypothetical protein